MVSLSGTMTQNDTTRITLRLPAKLHQRVSDSASDCGASLNAHIVRLINTGLEEDVGVRLMSLPEEDWPQEIESMRKLSQQYFDRLLHDIKRMWAMKLKKGAA
jgi:hypothetical protein